MAELAARFPRNHDLVETLFGPPAETGLYVSRGCRGALMFGSVSPQLGEDDVLAIAELLVSHSVSDRGDDRLSANTAPRPVASIGASMPWSHGYVMATEWAEKTGLWRTKHSWVEIEKHLNEYGVSVRKISLRDRSIGAIAIASDGSRPLIATNTSNPRNQFLSGLRFTLAHELCHLLYDRQHGVELATISGAWAPYDVERRANAFAARLLMPDCLLDRALAGTGVDIDRLDFEGTVAMAKRLRVSADALLNHLTNRGRIADELRDQLIAHLENKPARERNR